MRESAHRFLVSLRHHTPSRVLFVGLAGFLVGVGIASILRIPFSPAIVISGVVMVVGGEVARRNLTYVLVVVALGGIFVGISRRSWVDLGLDASVLQANVGQVQVLDGVVMTDPRLSSSVEIFNVAASGGKIVVITRPTNSVQRGDIIRLNCIVERQSSEFVCPFPKNITTTGHVLATVEPLYRIKESFLASMQRVFPEPAAGFLSALLLGGSSGLTPRWRDTLRATGTAHLVALSGYNVTIIGSMIMSMLSWLAIPRRWRLPCIMLMLTLFVIMVGAGASIVRAAIMGMLVVLARHLGRESSVRNVVVFAASLMLLHDPTLLVDDIGFQLSFLATIAMLTLYPWLAERTETWPSILGGKDALLMAIAAEVFVTPLLLYHFGQLSIIAPLTNALVVPFIPLLMLGGFLGGLFGLVSTTLGQIVGYLGWIGATLVLHTISLSASLPFAVVPFIISLPVLVTYYVVLSIWCLKKKQGVAK